MKWGTMENIIEKLVVCEVYRRGCGVYSEVYGVIRGDWWVFSVIGGD